MAEARIHTSLSEVDRAAWNACFPNELEDYDYLRVTETSGLAGFQWRYMTVTVDGQVRAAMPAFFTDYALDTTLDGAAKKITTAIRRVFPKALTLKLACLGSPVTEVGQVGFHASVAEAEKPVLLSALLTAFEAYAVSQGYSLLAVKDVAAPMHGVWTQPLTEQGYAEVGGLPVATLPIDFATLQDYVGKLSSSTRKDMRRKLRSQGELRIEERTNIDDVLPQVMALYQATHARADMQFEELTPAFFTGLLTALPERAICSLYWAGEELLAFNLLLKNETTLLDKFFCMDARGREFNLYFVSWFTNVNYCLGHQLTLYQSGAAGYENKLRLGSTLVRTQMCFKHTNRWVQRVLKLISPLLSADEPNQEAA